MIILYVMHTCACAARVTVVGSVCVSVTRHLTSRVFVRSSHKDTVSGTAHVFTYACASQCAEGLHFSAFLVTSRGRDSKGNTCVSASSKNRGYDTQGQV